MSVVPVNAPSLEGWLAASPDSLSGSKPDWLERSRRDALLRVREQGIPTTKDEGWRYTGLKGLIEKDFAPSAEILTAVQPEDVGEFLIPGLDAYRVVLANGRYLSQLSHLDAIPAGVRAGSLREVLETHADALEGRLTSIAGDVTHVFSAVNTAAMDDGFVLLVDEDVALDRPIEVIHLSVGREEPRVAQPRHLIVLQEGARAELIERYVSMGDSLYCTNSVMELSLGRKAELTHSRVQIESPNAFHITGLYMRLQGESRYEGVNVGLGAAWARNDLAVRFAGQGAQCRLRGLYLAGDKQVSDYHLDVDHAVPQCASDQNFKGILHGKGRAVFDGRIHVAVDAQKTDAHLSNKNLLLSRNAEVDTKPQLEIFADDVKCSHGTTVGQIEPEMLFYLRSRGISAPQARRMLCVGFAGEIIAALGQEALRDHVTEQVGQRLERAPLN